MRYDLPSLAAAVLLAGAAMTATSANAATAIDLISPSDEVDGSTLTLGFQFSTDTNLTVTALGAYDDAGDGLFFDAPVGIWDTDGKLLASAVVPKDAPGGLDNGFRYADIAPLELTAGVHYVIGAFYAGDFATSFDTGLGGSAAVDPHVHIEEDRFANTGQFAFPGLSSDTRGAWIGPNFQFASVPEPASWALMITGFGLVGAHLRARRRTSAA